MTYTVEFDSAARGWNVIDSNGEVAAMFDGGNTAHEQARRCAARLTRLAAVDPRALVSSAVSP